MLRTLKLEAIEFTLTSIWEELKGRQDEAGRVLREVEVISESANSNPRLNPNEPASHYVYEDSWMEEACEVLGVVEHVDAASGLDNETASLSKLLDVSFNLYILLLTLSSWSSEVAALIDHLPGSRYFKRMVGTIEIARQSVLEKVYFRIPSTCSGLSRQARHKVLWDLRDKDSRAAKLTAFFEVSSDLIAEMKYLHNIRSEVQKMHLLRQQMNPPRVGLQRVTKIANHVTYRLRQFFTSPASQDSLRNWNVVTALFINIVLVATYSIYEFSTVDLNCKGASCEKQIFRSVNRTDPRQRVGHGLVYLFPWMFSSSPMAGLWDDILTTLLEVLCYCHVVLALADVYLWWVLRIRRLLLEVVARNKIKPTKLAGTGQPDDGHEIDLLEVARRVYDLLPKETVWGLLWRVFLVLVSLAGLHSPFFSALHLLAVIPQSSHLRNVVSAVSLNGKTLLMTFAFGVLVVYLFSLLGYLLFPEDFVGDDGVNDPNCLTLLQCFVFTLMNGMRSGGGVGDIISKTPLWDGVHHSQRMMFDYLFFVGVIVILLSIVSGIITDSFTELRKRKDDFEDEIRNFCFICGVECSTFERYLKGGFKAHTKHEHNMWNYLYFHHHLLTKAEDEFTGQESFVWEKIQDQDFSFYPINRSMSLQELGVLSEKHSGGGEENEREGAAGELNQVLRRLDGFEGILAQNTSRINQVVQQVEALESFVSQHQIGSTKKATFDHTVTTPDTQAFATLGQTYAPGQIPSAMLQPPSVTPEPKRKPRSHSVIG